MSVEELRLPRWRVVQWFGAAVAVLFAVAVLGLVLGLLALDRLGEARRLVVDRIDPALVSALRMSNALLDEETGVRGFTLAGDATFLAPYTRGRGEENTARRQLRRLVPEIDPRVISALAAVTRSADAWRRDYAAPIIADVRAGRRSTFTPADQARGKVGFDRVRSDLDVLTGSLRRERVGARAELSRAADQVQAIFIAFGVLLLVAVVGVAWLLRQVIVAPLGRLAARVREVAAGDFGRRVEGDGALEVVELAADVDAMRVRIVTERDELARSNAELEQFAYVASHDLQEPLRKVASFSQMLQRRYAGQLDERADTYIEFAVDGAKRMQDLINDLLAFSRVGRLTEPEVVVDAGALVEQAVATLETVIEETGATVEVGPLPEVRGEPALLRLVFQNLIGNGLKFRGEAPPRVTVACERDGDAWRFTVADNGIGIEPEYADRIFVIFQRLHPRTSYDGTGIGLAMCRKVIEYHGGRIWLDTGYEGGAAFHFTLPVIPEDPDEEEPDSS